jgi:hypothetical protein
MADFDHDQQEPAGLDGLPAMYSIVKGEVASVQTYGAFIKIPGYRKQGRLKASACFSSAGALNECALMLP